MNLTANAIAAVFPDRDAALATFHLLKQHAFAEPWMATTRPADGESSRNDVADSSDGVLGAIGRFFTGEGNSLRRSLEDHGIDPDEAAALDEALPPLGAIVTVFVDERHDLAVQILEQGGGRIDVSRRREPDPNATGTVERSLVVVDSSFKAPMINEDVFVERRPLVPTPVTANKPLGLNDML